MLPDQAWELRLGSSRPTQGQDSPFARHVQEPSGSAGPDWRSLGPERLRRVVSLSAGQARGPYPGSLGWCWSGCLPVRSASRLGAVKFPAPGWTLASDPSASGWRSPMSERPDPLPVARLWGLNSGLSARRFLGHLPLRPASGLKPVKSPMSERQSGRSRGPGLLLAGWIPWWHPGSPMLCPWEHLLQPSPGKPLMLFGVEKQFWSGLSSAGPMRRTCAGSKRLG